MHRLLICNPDFDYAKMSDEEAEVAREDLIQTKGFFILPSELFCNVRAKADNDENLNETLEHVFKAIESSAARVPLHRMKLWQHQSVLRRLQE